MRSIFRRQRTPPAEPEVVEPVAAPESVGVTFWTANGSHHVGAVMAPNSRLSDALNEPAATEMFGVPIDELLIVAPPAQATNTARRLHRPGQPVNFSVGPYVVSGTVQVPAAAEAIAFFLRHRQRFVAVQRASIRSEGSPVNGPVLDVLLVNFSMAHSTRNPEATPSATGEG